MKAHEDQFMENSVTYSRKSVQISNKIISLSALRWLSWPQFLINIHVVVFGKL